MDLEVLKKSTHRCIGEVMSIIESSIDDKDKQESLKKLIKKTIWRHYNNVSDACGE